MKRIMSILFVLIFIISMSSEVFAECVHEWDEGTITKVATCKSEGEILKTCKKCGATLKEPTVIVPENHVWGDYVVKIAATCVAPGTTERKCTLCGATQLGSIPIDENAHLWGKGIETKAASYEAEGVMTYTCENDPTHTKPEAIPKLKYVDSLSITPKTLEMTIGDPAVTLTVSAAPSDAANKAVEWTSSNTSIVTVNSSGVLVPVSAGTANIRAVAVDRKSVYDICTVTVKNKSADPAPGPSDLGPSGGSGTIPSGPAPVDPSLPGPPTPPGPYTEYTITYHPGAYGQGTPQAFTMAPGPGWLLGPTFTRPGYAQTGWSWYYDGKEKNADIFSVFAMPPRDIIVYPYWEPVKGPVTLSVGYSGSGAVQVNGRYVYNGEVFTLREGDSLTFGLYPSYGNYVYSVLLGNRYREVNTAYGYTITYDMLQGRNQTLLIRFESVYCRPKTGDDSNIALWAVLGACSVVCLGVLLVAKRKKK